jgi:hypothetical protein
VDNSPIKVYPLFILIINHLQNDLVKFRLKKGWDLLEKGIGGICGKRGFVGVPPLKLNKGKGGWGYLRGI